MSGAMFVHCQRCGRLLIGNGTVQQDHECEEQADGR